MAFYNMVQELGTSAMNVDVVFEYLVIFVGMESDEGCLKWLVYTCWCGV